MSKRHAVTAGEVVLARDAITAGRDKESID